MVDVFISYTRTDRAQIESLARILEDDGYSVWWDHNIAGGAAFAAEIERALNDAKAVVVADVLGALRRSNRAVAIRSERSTRSLDRFESNKSWKRDIYPAGTYPGKNWGI